MPPSNNLVQSLRQLIILDLNRVNKAQQILELIRAHGQYRWAGLYDVDLGRGVVSNIAWSGSGPPEFPVFPIDKGITSRAIAEKRTVNAGNVTSDPHYLTALETTQSEIILPVFDPSGQVIGTLDIESDQPNAFDASQQNLLEACAGTLSEFYQQ